MKVGKGLWLAAVIGIGALFATACPNGTDEGGGDNGIGIETVQVAGGSFMFHRDGDEPYGSLTETLETVAGFKMGKYAVTQAQWKAVMGENPSAFDGTNKWDSYDEDYNDIYVAAGETYNRENLPVETVRWYDVLVFANKLSMKEGLNPAYRINGSTNPGDWGEVPTVSNDDWNAVEEVAGANGWRMPTEVEWEFAAKGGTKSAGYTGKESDTYFKYSGSDDAEVVAWYTDNSGDRTHEVGKKAANELGLYDMSGNVYEWCFDKYDPTGSGAGRVLRGGSWYNSADYVRSAFRLGISPSDRLDSIGFRLVRP